MVDTADMEPLPTPVWMNHDGKEGEESDALGCMVSHRLCYPELCFVGDKVGGNISMKGDGNADGKKLCTKQGTTPYEKASSTDKRCTMIGITALDESPVMYLLIIQGKEANVLIEINIDVTINPEGKPDDLDFFFNNSGESKYFPGGSVCTKGNPNIDKME